MKKNNTKVIDINWKPKNATYRKPFSYEYIFFHLVTYYAELNVCFSGNEIWLNKRKFYVMFKPK